MIYVLGGFLYGGFMPLILSFVSTAKNISDFIFQIPDQGFKKSSIKKFGRV
jgi:hypothetical protein